VLWRGFVFSDAQTHLLEDLFFILIYKTNFIVSYNWVKTIRILTSTEDNKKEL